MNIVVCIKAVPANVQLPVPRPDGSGLVADGDAFMNESDDYALEQALLIKRSVGGKVTALTLGPIKSQDALHVCVAKGADEALRVDADEFDPNLVAVLLAAALRTLECDLVLTGVESADGMGSQVAVSVAAHLDMPCMYAVNKVEFDDAGGPLRVTRELGGGRHQMLAVRQPALLCVQSGSVPLTYAPVVKLIHARRRGIPTLSPADLQISDADLAARRKTRLRAIATVDKSSTTQWLTGTPAELAAQIMNKIGHSTIMNTEILIIAEHDGAAPDPLTLEVIGWGARIAAEKNWRLGVLALGSGLDGVIEALRNTGADAVYALDDAALGAYSSQAFVAAILASVSAVPPRVILLGHSYVGIELASAIAVKNGATLWSNCLSVKAAGDAYIASRPMYGGTYVTTLEIESAACNVFTMQRGGLSAPATAGKTAELHRLPVPAPAGAPAITITGETRATFAEDITRADLLVSVGRGIGQASHLDAFRDLAGALGGSLAASRPIVDNGWLPVDNQVGLSGRTVRPKVYLAFGISGSAQHMAGMRDSQMIIAVNQDPNAPIFQIAHFGIVADLFQVLPPLMDAVKAAGAGK